MTSGIVTHQVLFALGVGVLTFVSTNIDCAVVLIPSLWVGDGRRRGRYIAGCGIGNCAVLAAAALAAAGLTRLPGAWTAWLGVVPILMGLLSIRRNSPDPAQPQLIPSAATGLIVTSALGVDNVLVLAPVIRAFGRLGGVVVLVHLLLFPTALALVARARPGRLGHWHRPRAAGYLTIAVGALLLGRQLIL
ncbi:hypothetical protein [Nocardia stercoris]|uniref:Permease n=1 Tax=Nocardia stercoris TaxID=2483361 RepID=A0A3M2KRN8_9NOCA|nr:hypothetical protein [Nocardia stercoris]RMI27741.1 hypothetical protein EBN03_33025 [Nocardia stercoris]